MSAGLLTIACGAQDVRGPDANNVMMLPAPSHAAPPPLFTICRGSPGIPIPGVQPAAETLVLPTPNGTARLPSQSTPGDAGATRPASQPTSTPCDQPIACPLKEGRVPTPWSAKRPWDPVDEAKDLAEGRTTRSGRAGSAARAAPAHAKKAAAPRRVTRSAKPTAAPMVPPNTSALPAAPRYLGFTSVSPELRELARVAMQKLPGMRPCPSGRGDAAATHLILGDDRRTIKVLLAAANGAHLLTPEYVTASLEAGEWLEETPFRAPSRFAAAAERARRAKSGGQPPLLEGWALHLQAPPTSASGRGPRGAGSVLGDFKRLISALGGRVCGPHDCRLCLLMDAAEAPASLPPATPTAPVEWLLSCAESMTVQQLPG